MSPDDAARPEPPDPTSVTAPGPRWPLTLTAWLVVAGVVAVPLIFWTGSIDSFALPKTNLVRLLLIALVVLGGAGYALGTKIRLRWDVVSIAAVTFWALTAIATVLSRDQQRSLVGEDFQYQGLLAVTVYVLFFLATRMSFSGPTWLERLAVAAAIAAAAVAGYAILQWFDLDPFWDTVPGDRVFSTIGQSNALAGYLVTLLPFLAAMALWWRGAARWLMASVVAVTAWALVLTLSRGGYVAALVALGVFVVIVASGSRLPARRLMWGAGAAVAFIAAVLLIVSVSGSVADRVASLGDRTDISTRQRLDLWVVGLHISADHPLFGTGPETYPEAFEEYREQVLSPDRARAMGVYRPESPHNVPIALAAGMGWPAVVAYLVVIGGFGIAMLRAGRSSDRRSVLIAAGLAAAVAAHFITDLFMTAEVAGSWTMWVLMGAGLAFLVDHPGSLTVEQEKPAAA